MTSTATFDLDALHRGHAQHDAAILTSLYAEDAVLEIVNTTSPPSDPRRLVGVDAIRGYYEDVCSRDMTHEVEDAFSDGEHLAFRVACRYDTGERVLTSETCRLRDGRIASETLVKAWDG